eukprot:TRINITY_DN12011_c0_g1_i1.p1 TRINITY_DN12011_c0_g1~~TRINITY_DN12011_c0_g1_i1.p1  ORF type:complete len:150 (-),score=43.89 TRINITY_DN12011_c0_g1_i1:257-706(-)
MASALKRATKELSDIEKSGSQYTVGAKSTDNMLEWTCTLFGPKDTPYAGGTFFLSIKLPEDYPFKPPKVAFTTKIYHPNVDEKKGEVCLATVSNWSPAMTVSKALDELLELLGSPLLDNPINSDACNMYKTDKKKFEKTAKDWVTKYAT